VREQKKKKKQKKQFTAEPRRHRVFFKS